MKPSREELARAMGLHFGDLDAAIAFRTRRTDSDCALSAEAEGSRIPRTQEGQQVTNESWDAYGSDDAGTADAATLDVLRREVAELRDLLHDGLDARRG